MKPVCVFCGFRLSFAKSETDMGKHKIQGFRGDPIFQHPAMISGGLVLQPCEVFRSSCLLTRSRLSAGTGFRTDFFRVDRNSYAE